MGVALVKKQLLRDIDKTFRTPHGKRVLKWLEERPTKLILLAQRPAEGQPNDAFVNPNAALYQAGMLDTFRAIKKYQKRLKELDDASEAEREGRGAGTDGDDAGDDII